MPNRSFSQRQRSPQPRSRGRGKGSRKPIVFVIGLVLGALVWFAPAIVVNSPLKDRILASAIGDFEGTISIQSISAGWLSKLTANSVVAFDAQGEQLVEATAIQLDKSLFSLIRDHSDLGTIRVRQPIVNLVLRPDGSNIEYAIAPWLAPSEDSSSVACNVVVEEGVLQVTNATTGAMWTATQLNVDVTMPKDATAPLTLHVDSQLNPPDGASGDILADLLLQRTDGSAGQSSVVVKATNVPIELANPALQRVLPGTAASGLLNGDVLLEWSDASRTARIGQLNAKNIRLFAPKWLGSDQVEVDALTASGEITDRSGAWQLQQLAVTSDVGQITADGSFAVVPSKDKSSTEKFIEALQNGSFQVDGQIDLARIARMLPTTLKIREGTKVATGEVTLELRSALDTNGQRWDGHVEARNLSAMYEGRHLTWDQPIVVTAAAREVNGLVAFDQLDCESSFLKVIGSGTSQQGAATLRGDLARFAAELGQFVDLGDTRLAGRLEGEVKWQATSDHRIQLSVRANADQFELMSATRPAWREDRLSVEFVGIRDRWTAAARALDEGQLTVRSGQDQLNLTLFTTPAGAIRDTALPLELRVTGELRNWVARLQPVFVLPGWSIDGLIDMNAGARIAGNSIQIDGAHVEVASLQASNGSVFINEPAFKIDTKGMLDRTTGAFQSPDTTIASSSIALRATNVDVRKGETGTHVAGDIDYRGDVGKLAALFNDPRQPATRQVGGQATGHVKLRHSDQITSCEWSADVVDFSYAIRSTQPRPQVMTASQSSADQWQTVWQEPKLRLAATAAYDSANDLVQLSRVEAAGDTVSFAAQGKLSELATRCITELDGQLAYDLQKLSSRFREQLGDNFQIAGRDTRSFSFRGPLFSGHATNTQNDLHPVSIVGNANVGTQSFESTIAQMIAQASLGWTSASVQGVAIGAGELDAKLLNGQLVFAPIKLDVSEGKVHLAPTVLLNKTPQIVTLPAGPVAERIRISPQMCTSWLKYLAPLVADATAAEGSFSVSLQKAIIPLDAPANGEVEGVLEIHNAQIGPGPLSQQLLLLASQIKAIADGNLLSAAAAPPQRWLDLPSQRIGFRMADNRVYHQGLQLTVKDVVIRTSGSVGADQTISLVAEVPVRDEWLSRSRHLAALRGESIRVPIYGTLTNPKLDQNALAQITQQTVTGAANRYLQDGVNQLQGEAGKQINRAFEKFLGTPRQ